MSLKINNKLTRAILKWYTQNRRDLPWRRSKDPYKIWISEMMLQQTRVEQVIPYYERFLKRFPNLHELAYSHLDDVLKIWEGLGYYRRARYIHSAAKIIVRKFNGKIPKKYELLKTLPGFGPYTCGSVLSIAYNIPYPAVDGNVMRLIARLFKVDSDVTLGPARKQIEGIVRRLIPANNASHFTQSLMEMGAIVCTPLKPRCMSCCCNKLCRAYNEMPNPAILPVKKKKHKGSHIHIAAAIIRKGNSVLISKRAENTILGNLWEFPGGKKEKNESLEKTCAREVKNKTGVTLLIEKPHSIVKHRYSHYSVTLHFFVGRYVKGSLKNSTMKWVKIPTLQKYAFSKVHKQIMMSIRDEYYS